MNKWKITLLSLILLSTLITADPVTIVEEGDFGTIGRGVKSVECLLKYIQDIYPLIVLAMIVMGAFKYMTGADDPQEQALGKKFIIMGVIGGICVVLLLHVACDIGFQGLKICPNNCQGKTIDDYINEYGTPMLIEPPPSDILT